MTLTLNESSLRGLSDGVHFFRTEAGAKLFWIAFEIEELRQISDVVVVLVAAFSDHKTARLQCEGAILVQRDAVVAERIFELVVVHLADRFDRPPGAA